MDGLDIGNLALELRWRHRQGISEATDAVANVLERFPLLGRRYERRTWRDRWVADPSAIERIICVAGPETDAATLAGQPLDVSAGPPWRLHVCDGGARWVIVIPHLVVDGNGLLTIAQALATAMAPGTVEELPEGRRDFLQLVSRLDARSLARVPAELVRDAVSFAAVLGQPTFHGSGNDGVLAPLRISVDEYTFGSWVKTVRARGATVNDGLLAEAMGIAGALSAGRHGAAFYTINLRRYLRERRPVIGNLSGFLVVRAGRLRIADPDMLLETVRHRTAAHKAGVPGIGSNLLPILLFGWLPHGLLRVAARGLRKGFLMLGRRALVMTNVGPIDNYLAPIAPLLDDAWMTAPSFPGFPSPISLVSSFRGRVNIAVSAGGPAVGASTVADAWRRNLAVQSAA